MLKRSAYNYMKGEWANGLGREVRMSAQAERAEEEQDAKHEYWR